ncbi:BRO1-like domain-containing protein [Scheffersomyces xylosifermentans]|uniref:BRO1-like domain-containing protein n=1 Tax=Scheffersomyces xylosifermentans TaxID=1304137 RepID=UPI00315CEE22
MNTNLLYVPFRQSRAIDLGAELREVIRKDYFQTPSSFETDLLRITNLRNKVTALKGENLSVDNENTLKEYYVHLSSIRKKFADNCIEFGWYDTLTYGPSGPTKSRSLRVEQLNVIFQLGSLYSQLALLESRHTDEGLKNACSYFQMAAGCFELIASIVKKESEDSTSILQIPRDLQRETIECLKYLMLAQAQETIWQKALGNPSMKDTVIARLSIQTSTYYSQALEDGNKSDYIKLEWINHMGVKKFHFKAAALYRMSIVSQDIFEYGDQVAFLRAASASCDSALKYKKYVAPFVVEDLQGLTTMIKDVLRVAEKDNDLVYLKIVPNEKDLKPIAGVSMVKPTIPEQLSTPTEKRKPIFNELLPYIVIQVAQAFRERQDKFIQEKFVDPIHALNKLFTKFITDRGLPASIDSIQQPENLPDSITQHSQEIVSFGGIQIIEDSITEIRKLAVESRQVLEQCQNRLKLDMDEDEMLRQRQGSQHWGRPRTEEAASQLIERIQKMSNYLEQAKAGDDQVTSNYYEIRPYLEVYCSGYKGLIDFIPNSTYTKLDRNISVIVSDLREAVNQASVLEQQRKQFLMDLEIKSREKNILPSVIEEFKAKQDKIYDENGNFLEREFESVYEKHILEFTRDMKFIESTKSKQESLEHDLDTLNNRFVSEYSDRSNESQSKRKDVLQTLETVYSKYLEAISNLNEGSKFYSDFILKGNGVLLECEEYLHNRRMEGRELEIAIANRFRENTPVIQPPQEQVSSKENVEISPSSSPGKSHRRPVKKNEDNRVPLFSPTSKPGVWNPNQGIKFG